MSLSTAKKRQFKLFESEWRRGRHPETESLEWLDREMQMATETLQHLHHSAQQLKAAAVTPGNLMQIKLDGMIASYAAAESIFRERIRALEKQSESIRAFKVTAKIAREYATHRAATAGECGDEEKRLEWSIHAANAERFLFDINAPPIVIDVGPPTAGALTTLTPSVSLVPEVEDDMPSISPSIPKTVEITSMGHSSRPSSRQSSKKAASVSRRRTFSFRRKAKKLPQLQEWSDDSYPEGQYVKTLPTMNSSVASDTAWRIGTVVQLCSESTSTADHVIKSNAELYCVGQTEAEERQLVEGQVALRCGFCARSAPSIMLESFDGVGDAWGALLQHWREDCERCSESFGQLLASKSDIQLEVTHKDLIERGLVEEEGYVVYDSTADLKVDRM